MGNSKDFNALLFDLNGTMWKKEEDLEKKEEEVAVEKKSSQIQLLIRFADLKRLLHLVCRQFV